MLENECCPIEQLLTCFNEGLAAPLATQPSTALRRRYLSARERGIQNFALGKPGWFFLTVTTDRSKFAHLAAGYATSSGERLALNERLILPSALGQISPEHFASESEGINYEVFDWIREAIDLDSPESAHRILRSITKDPFYHRFLNWLFSNEKLNDWSLFPYIELLLCSQLPFAAGINHKADWDKRCEWGQQALACFREPQDIKAARDLAFSDAQEALLILDFGLQHRKKS